MEQVGTRLEQHWGHSGWPFWPICHLPFGHFASFWPLLDSKSQFCTIFTWKEDPKWFDWMPLLCSNLVPPWPTQNRPSRLICVANRLFSAYLGLFLAAMGPYLGDFRSGKWAKLVSLNDLSAVPALFQPVPLNRWSHMTLLVKMPIWAFYWSFLGPGKAQIWKMPGGQVGTEVSALMGPEKNHWLGQWGTFTKCIPHISLCPPSASFVIYEQPLAKPTNQK